MSCFLCGKAEDVGSIRLKGEFNQKHSKTHSFLSCFPNIFLHFFRKPMIITYIYTTLFASENPQHLPIKHLYIRQHLHFIFGTGGGGSVT